jgi:hypothetical protein
MNIELINISELTVNPNNPRVIKDEKFEKLVQSVKDFPDMLKLRPIVVDENNVILGGNMRFKACKAAKLKQVPVMKASELTEAQKREFIIKDNVSGGEWDWAMLQNEWDTEQLDAWGVDFPGFEPEIDYSILDGEDLSDSLTDMQNGVMKAIQIEFEPEHYNEAYGLVKFWRERKSYVGGMLIEYLKAEKNKL